jgi:hypothetical protein
VIAPGHISLIGSPGFFGEPDYMVALQFIAMHHLREGARSGRV